MRQPLSSKKPDDDWSAAALLATALTLSRIVVLFRTPRELLPVEIHGWMASRAPSFGGWTNPPMSHWAIRATSLIGGDAEPWVRLSSPIFQAGAMLILFAIARRLYGGRTALAAMALYALAPVIQAGALTATPHAAAIFGFAVTLAAAFALAEAQGARRLLVAVGAGLALGVCALSDPMVAVAAALGMLASLAVTPQTRRAWSPATMIAAAAGMATLLAPMAFIGRPSAIATPTLSLSLGTPASLWGLGGLATLVAAAAWQAARGRLSTPDRGMLCFAVAASVLTTAQSLTGHAGGIGAAWLPGAALAASWLMRLRARRTLIAILIIESALAAAGLAAWLRPGFPNPTGMGDDFAAGAGGRQIARIVTQRAGQEDVSGLFAVVTSRQAVADRLAYDGRAYFSTPGAPRLVVGVSALRPGERSLVIADDPQRYPALLSAFTDVTGHEIDSVMVDRGRMIRLDLFVGKPVAAGRAEAVSGPPTPP